MVNERDAMARMIDGTLSGTDLRRRGALLSLAAIQPGDVLLTRGHGAESTVIAKATSGEFSHAAIWLPNSVGGCVLAESDDSGIGYTPLSIISLLGSSGPPRLLVPLPGPPLAVKLLRHPKLAQLSREDLRAATARIEAAAFSRSYPDLVRLLDAAGPGIPRSLTRAVLSIADRFYEQRPTRITGPFCSELVVQFFQEIGVQLFDELVEPRSVSPNRLASKTSLLREVEDAFLSVDAINDDDHGTETVSVLVRDEFLPKLVVDHEQDAAIRALGDDVDEVRRQALEDQRRISLMSQDLGRQLAVNAWDAFLDARSQGDHSASERLRRLASQALLLHHMGDAIATRRSALKPDDAAAPMRHSLLQIEHWQARMRSDLRYRLNRRAMLRRIRAFRSEDTRPGRWLRKLRAKKGGRSLLQQVELVRYLHRVTDGMQEELVGDFARATSCLVDDVLREATAAAASDWQRLTLILETREQRDDEKRKVP